MTARTEEKTHKLQYGYNLNRILFAPRSYSFRFPSFRNFLVLLLLLPLSLVFLELLEIRR
jgi:hypothetical protein